MCMKGKLETRCQLAEVFCSLQSVQFSAAVIVTTPQKLAFVDVAKGIRMFARMAVPCVAVAENMSFFDTDDGKRCARPATSILSDICTFKMRSSQECAVGRLSRKLIVLKCTLCMHAARTGSS